MLQSGVKLFFRRISFFTLFLVSVYILFLFLFSFKVFRNKVPNLYYFPLPIKYLFGSIDTSKHTDILFLGSSHSEFVPDVFQHKGISAITLTIGSLRPINEYYFLKSELKKTSARVVALETYYNIMNENYFANEAAIAILSNEPIDINNTEMAFATRNFPVINSEFGILAGRVTHPVSFYDSVKPIANNSAIIPVSENEKEGPHSSEFKFDPYYSTVTKRAMEYLKKSIELIKESGKTPMLIMAPVTQEYKSACRNYDSINHAIIFLAKSEGIVFLNYNDSARFERMNLKSNIDFADGNHLNKTARIKFSEAVLNDLKQMNLIKK